MSYSSKWTKFWAGVEDGYIIDCLEERAADPRWGNESSVDWFPYAYREAERRELLTDEQRVKLARLRLGVM